MTVRWFEIVSISALAACAACAQNSDLGLLVGVTVPTAEVVIGPNSRVSASAGVNGQINYAWKLLKTRAGDLYIELPVVAGTKTSARVSHGVAAAGRNLFLFTPGARFRLPLQSRVSLYGALGGGVGLFDGGEVHVDKIISISGGRTVSGVLDFGGGVDVRLARLLSLRGEIRDFVSLARFGGFAGRHNPIVALGVGLHF